AADVFPTPGGPYSIICCGYGDAILDKRDFIGLSCPIISEKEAEQVLMEKQDKYIEEVKLNILKKQKGPENAKTLKKYAHIEVLE
ncbi:hypothetical protein EXM35_18620, partial [Clostridium botulinum]|nr:hypothetical protein [Clostridium botulinum]